jgi:hypothetical protein
VYVYKNAKGLYEIRLEDRLIGTIDQQSETEEDEGTERKTCFTEEADSSAINHAATKFKDDGTEITPDSIMQSTGQADRAQTPDQISQAGYEQRFDKGSETRQLSATTDDKTKIETANTNCDDTAKQQVSLMTITPRKIFKT